MPQAAEKKQIVGANCSRWAFVRECRRYLGVRWQHQGRSDRGIDCVGLLVVPALKLGILQPQDDITDYQRAPHGDRLDCLLHHHCRRLSDWREAKEGDILAIKYLHEPQHVMIVTKPWNYEWGFFVIHSFGNDSMPGKVVEHRLDSNWLNSHRARIHAAFHIKGVRD